MIPRSQIDRLVEELPPLPGSAASLVNLLGDEHYRMDDVVAVVETDAALAIRVLNVVNSAAFGLRESVDAVDRAVSYLGARGVVTIAMSSCASELFDVALDGYPGSAGHLWTHGLRAAVASRLLSARAVEPCRPELAYLGGLLLDVGKHVLAQLLGRPAVCRRRRNLEETPTADSRELEQILFGWDHCAVGQRIARFWALSEPLRQVLVHHHDPASAEPEHEVLVHVCHAGDVVAACLDRPAEAARLARGLRASCRELLDLEPDDLPQFAQETAGEFEKLRSLLGG